MLRRGVGTAFVASTSHGLSAVRAVAESEARFKRAFECLRWAVEISDIQAPLWTQFHEACEKSRSQHCNRIRILINRLSKQSWPPPFSSDVALKSNGFAIDPHLDLTLQRYQQRAARLSMCSSIHQCRVVICRPDRGLGNRLQGILSCLAFAIASNRALLIDWQRPANTSDDWNSYLGASLKDLFKSPDWLNWDARPFVERFGENAVRKNSLFVYERGGVQWVDELVCGRLEFQQPVVLFWSMRWMPSLVTNTNFYSFFKSWLGTEKDGTPRFTQLIGSALFSPVHDITKRVSRIRDLLSGWSVKVNVQARLGMDVDKERAVQTFLPSEVDSFLECGYSSLRPHGEVAGWLLIADSVEVKRQFVQKMILNEGGVVGYANIDQLGISLQGVVPSSEDYEKALPLGVAIIDFSSGSRLVLPVEEVSRGSVRGL